MKTFVEKNLQMYFNVQWLKLTIAESMTDMKVQQMLQGAHR